MSDPLIHGGSRMTWTAAIVLGCILLAGLVMVYGYFSLPGEASAGSLVGDSCFKVMR